MDIDKGLRGLEVGEPGELIIRGPQVMQGYLNRAVETRNVVKDGWLYTGDIAKMDADGYFYILDRKQEMIISATGLNVYPHEIEEVLYTHPKVKDVAVIGVPSEKRGELIKAFIVTKAGEVAAQEEILSFCEERLAKYKVPELIEFRESLPKSMIGKVLKRILLEEEIKKCQTSDQRHQRKTY